MEIKHNMYPKLTKGNKNKLDYVQQESLLGETRKENIQLMIQRRQMHKGKIKYKTKTRQDDVWVGTDDSIMLYCWLMGDF